MASSSEKSAAKANLLGKQKPEEFLETKSILRKYMVKERTKGFADTLQHIELLETKSDQANLISVKEAAIRKNTLYVYNLSVEKTGISDIIRFFDNVGQVIRVQLILNKRIEYVGFGFVEFASSNEAKKAPEKKNGEYLHDRKIYLAVAKKYPYPSGYKYCVEHKVCYKDYLRPKSLLIEEDEAVEGIDETPNFVEEVLFIANLSPQTKMAHIIYFFKYVVEVVSVRLIVNDEGKHVGYGFVEFASANEAKKALKKKNGKYLHDHKIFLNVAKKAPYSPGPKYNLAEILCYEDYLRRESLLIEEDETVVDGLDESPDLVEEVTIREKTLFVDNLSGQTEISHIINFFKDVGEVVHVRLIVDNMCKHVGYGFVEFASANEAQKALEKNNGEYLHDHKIFLDVAKKCPYPPRFKYCIDHKVWYEDYLRRESMLIEENEADFVEEVAIRKKTVFVYNMFNKVKISFILGFFKDVGDVVGLRLIVNEWDDFVSSGFVEFASANQAEKALQMKDREKLCSRKIYVDMVEIAPYLLQPKYNLAEKLCYEDYLQQERLEENDLETKPNLKVPIFWGKKITFTDY